MATYGYAGDFSSDDDEKLEQAQVPAKYDNNVRPNKTQIEAAIESIKQLPFDQEINLSDDILAGLLDYFQCQRGPIVDSTRKLYNRIALRLVRENQSKAAESNGKNLHNNNNIGANKGASQQSAADAFSSDDEELEATGKLNNNPKKFDSSVVYNNNNVVDVDEAEEEDKMEVDSEATSAAVRNNKPIELATTDDDDSSSGGDENQKESSTEETSRTEGSSDESDVLEVTPIKLPGNKNREKEAIETLMGMRPSTPKQSDSTSIKRQPLAHSTPKESVVDTAKKPYTRSQRVTTRSATKGSRNLQGLDGKDTSSSSTDAFIVTKRNNRTKNTLLTGTIIVLALAFLAYYFRSSLSNAAEPLFRKKLTF